METACNGIDAALLHAPQPWMRTLISGDYLDSDSKVSLFQTCRQLNEVVLQHSQHMSLGLDMLATPPDAAYKSLLHASKHLPSIKLKLHQTLSSTYELREHDVEFAFKQMGHIACSFLHAAAEAEHRATDVVRALQLERAWLPVILPAPVGEACPNLTKLTLQSCHIDGHTPVNASKHFQKLECLELIGVRFSDPDDVDSNASIPIEHSFLRAQFRVDMPALQSLTVLSELGQDMVQVSDIQLVNALAGQLTHLCSDWFVSHDLGLCNFVKDLKWVQLGSTLRHLRLCRASVVDADIEMFLQMPCLNHIEVHCIMLLESFVGRTCKWQELTCHGTTVKTITHLPLHSGLAFKVGEPVWDSFLYLHNATPDLVQQAIDIVSKCQGTRWVEMLLGLQSQQELNPLYTLVYPVYTLPRPC